LIKHQKIGPQNAVIISMLCPVQPEPAAKNNKQPLVELFHDYEHEQLRLHSYATTLQARCYYERIYLDWQRIYFNTDYHTKQYIHAPTVKRHAFIE